MDLRYSYQSAVDMTPDSYSYGQQIPYIAKHTVTASVKVLWKGYELNPRWVLKSGRNDATGNLADWNTLDLTLSKTFKLRGPLSLGINIAARNLLDCRYELVSGYPMPGRSFIGGVEMKF
jgi:outer membrane receptor protein involved in Fe transport